MATKRSSGGRASAMAAPGSTPVSRLLPSARQLVAAARIRRRHVEIERAQRTTASVPDLVAVTALDHDQRAGAKRMASPVDDRDAAAGLDEEPLISAAMAVVRAALCVPWRD